MNPKTFGMAALLAALCLMPAASAEWGPDVTVTASTNAIQCVTDGQSAGVGPASVSSDDCKAAADFDGVTVGAVCDPKSTPPAGVQVSVASDCHVFVDA